MNKKNIATLQIHPRVSFQGEDLFGRRLDHQPSQKPSLSSGILGCIKRVVLLLLSKLSVMLTVNYIILHVEAIIYKHMSDEFSWYLQKWMYKVMYVSLRAKWQARSRNEAGIQELSVPMPFIQILSYKDEVWEQQHNEKNAADSHQVLCTHSVAILDASLQAIWLPCCLKYLRVDLDICKPSCRANQQQCSRQIPQSKDAWFSTGGKRYTPAKPDDGQ